MSNFQFGNVPVIKHSRSRFDLSHNIKTAFNVGDLVPVDIEEVYAGDTFKVKTFTVSRLSNQFIRPVMDNLFLDVYYFFVPSRILYDKFVNVFGENTESAWANTQEYSVPTLDVEGDVVVGSVADYLGLPVGELKYPVNVLPFRAFAKIYDDWFRDENNVQPMHIQKGELGNSEVLNNAAWSPVNYTGMLPKVAKFHDLFTSCLPAPQKGNAVDVPVGGLAPVVTGDSDIDLDSTHPGLRLRDTSGAFRNYTSLIGTYLQGSGDVGATLTYINQEPSPDEYNEAGNLVPSNLYADISSVSSVSVNDLRYAFQYQRMLERDARSGSRFVEYLQSHFGVSPGDYRLQRSEFLGGKRTPISIHQVTQTTGENNEDSPLGSVGAFSLSNGSSRFTKGFTENGYVLTVACIRQFHTYQQGIDKHWFRSKRSDYYDPVFSHIGEQPIYKKQLYAVGNNAPASDAVFGYQEAWIELRQRASRITGQMRTGVSASLDVWHFGDFYSAPPVLGKQFIEETPNYVDRAITVESSDQAQFIVDFYVQNIAYRELPTYSVPGLIDHN